MIWRARAMSADEMEGFMSGKMDRRMARWYDQFRNVVRRTASCWQANIVERVPEATGGGTAGCKGVGWMLGLLPKSIGPNPKSPQPSCCCCCCCSCCCSCPCC